MLLDRVTFHSLVRARELLSDVAMPVREVARQVAISPFHFIRLFAATFGVTPHQFRTQARIERAKQLLERNTQSVTEICLEVGFSSLGSFSAMFSRRVGVAPSTYRAAPHAAAPGCVTLMTQLPPDAFRRTP